MPTSDFPGTGFDPSRPHIARVYDYLLGGKDNYEADRQAGDHIIATLPAVQAGVRAQRAVLGRVVRYLVSQAGIRQLIDVGSGLPTVDNLGAGSSAPGTRFAACSAAWTWSSPAWCWCRNGVPTRTRPARTTGPSSGWLAPAWPASPEPAGYPAVATPRRARLP